MRKHANQRGRVRLRMAWLAIGWFLVGSLPAGSARCADRVRIGLSVRNVVFLPFYYAKDMGHFARHGIDAELIQMRSDLQTVGLVSGELDFNPAIGPATLAIANGLPLRAVAVFYRAPLFALVGQSGVAGAKELDGQKVAVSRLGSDSHRYASLMLENSGVDPKKITFIQTGSTTVSLTALQQGSVAAAVLSPPFTGAMAQKGFRVLAKSRSLVEAPWLGLVTSRDKIARQPERVKNVLRAMRDALSSIRADRAGVVAYIERNFKVGPEIAGEAYEDIDGVLVDGLTMPEARIDSHLESIRARGEISKPLSAADVFDFTLLNSLK